MWLPVPGVFSEPYTCYTGPATCDYPMARVIITHLVGLDAVSEFKGKKIFAVSRNSAICNFQLLSLDKIPRNRYVYMTTVGWFKSYFYMIFDVARI